MRLGSANLRSRGATENTPPNFIRDPTYRNEYWRYRLDAAVERRCRCRLETQTSPTRSREGDPCSRKLSLDCSYRGPAYCLRRAQQLLAGHFTHGRLPQPHPDARYPSHTAAVTPEVALRAADKTWKIWGDGTIRGSRRPVLALGSAWTSKPNEGFTTILQRTIGNLTMQD